MYQQLFEIIAPVALIAGLGFLWERLKKPFDLATVTQVAINLAVPCLVLASLSKLTVELATFGAMAGAAAATFVLFLAVGYAVLRLAGLAIRTFLPAVAFGNSGNLGLPLCLFAFGETGLALAIGVFAVSSVIQITLGQMIAAGRLNPALLWRAPVLYAVLIALALKASGAVPPKWLMGGIETLGQMAVPLMLVALGVSLARLSPGDLGTSAVVAAIRILLGFAGGIAIAELFGFEGAARGVLIIQSAMPAAVFNYLWAAHYGRDGPAVAGVVVVSTAMAFVLLPVLLAVALDPALMPWRW